MNPIFIAYKYKARYCGRCRITTLDLRCPDCGYLTRGRKH